ncbi:kappa-type opioid receptor-like [Diadema antillarum]|uniref:kappa-type opioid receptor-like n=1 Tax=Diadema antillarum TaxID=105358 RepID=UPI003A8519C5
MPATGATFQTLSETDIIISTVVNFVGNASTTTPELYNGDNADGVLSGDGSCSDGEWVWEPVVWSLRAIIQCIFSLLGIVGNFLVMAVLIQRRKAAKLTDALVGGLAAADFLTSVFMVPVPIPREVPDTFLGHAACKILESSVLLWMCVGASVATLTLIAVERYIAVVHPFRLKSWMNHRRAKGWIVAVWVFSAVRASHITVTSVVNQSTCRCELQLLQLWLQGILGMVECLALLIVPVTIMVVTHLLVARALRKDSARLSDLLSKSSTPAQNLMRVRQKISWLFLTILLAYVVCMCPDIFGFLLLTFGLFDTSFLQSALYQAFVLLAFCNSCINPIIYSIRLPSFRRALVELFTGKAPDKSKPSIFGPENRM